MQTSLPSLAAHVPASIRPSPPTRGAEVVTRDGRSLPLVSARLRAEAQGGIARLVLEQRFENRHAETLHVTYRMPLPADGAVSGYAFDIAGRTITGRIDRRRAARDQFERAVASGKTAALLEQDRADIFTQSIGNLPAGEALIARIAIDQKLVWLPDGEWELRFPTVVGPRYFGATETIVDAQASAVVTRADGVAARIQIAIKIGDAITAGRRPSSSSHALQVGSDGVVELRDVAGARLDRDIVVRWPVAGDAVGLSLAIARPAHGEAAYGLVSIVPPARDARSRALPRDLIVLVDTSGSMAGGPLDKAKQLIAMLIDSLDDDDRLELIEFSYQPRRYKPAAMAATRGEKQAAIRWLRGLTADGGTEMRAAVIEALRSLRAGSQRQVVLATDGYIGGEDQVVEQLYRNLPRSCRLHFLGVGSSVNRSLATAMARAGRGAEVVCDLDEAADRAAKRLIDRTRMPMLTDVAIEGSAVIAQAPERLPDVFEGAPLVAALELRAGELVVRGQLADGAWEKRMQVWTCRPGGGNQAIVSLFGRERVADLEARAIAGEPTDGVIEQAGLDFQIATRFTSWVAIDEARTVTGPSRREVMPQALPYGTTAAAFGLRELADEPTGSAMPMLDLGESPVMRSADSFDADLDELSVVRSRSSFHADVDDALEVAPRMFLGDEDEEEIDDAWEAASRSSQILPASAWEDVETSEDVETEHTLEVVLEPEPSDVTEQPPVGNIGMETSALISLEQLRPAQRRETSQLHALPQVRPPLEPRPLPPPPPLVEQPIVLEPAPHAWKAVPRCGPVWRWSVIAVLVILALATAILWFVR